MNRRDLLWAPLLLSLCQRAGAHTPYGQWVVYRKKHLLIGAHRADGATYDKAKRLTAVLAEHLPNSRCRVARAPTAGRLASLLGTDQLDVAVLSKTDALGMRNGEGKFAPYGTIALLLLAELGAHVLVAHERFPERHAWLVSRTLSEVTQIREDALQSPGEFSWHPGARLFLKGEPEPRQ